MALDRTLPIWTATLRRPGGPPLSRPLTLPAPVGVDDAPDVVAARLADAIRDAWMVTGDYAALIAAGVSSAAPIALELDLPEVDALRPAMKVPFVAVAAPTGDGVTVWVPAIDVVAWGEDPAAARVAAEQAIAAWMARFDAREDPRDLAVASGWASVDVAPVDELFEWYTLGERRELAERRGRSDTSRLDRATAPLASQRCFELDGPRVALARALDVGSVVLVGPRGSGKTALVRAVASPKLGASLRTSTAARLEVALTDDGAWQAAFATLCGELGRRAMWLHVASLADLFEVGRYVGNATSLGEFIAPWLARGELRLITECTAEEYARIEARYPGVLEHLGRIDVPAPDDASLARIVGAWARADGGVRGEAVDEAIRLQRRFLPYAGFPGVTLRLLAALSRVERPVTAAAVAARFSEESGIPRDFLDPASPLRVPELRARLEGALFGQPEALATLLDVLTAVKADVSPRGRPIATLLFTGPTGVGKTEAARALAAALFGHRDRMVRFDCSEIATPAAVARLVSSPDPHGEGLLTGAVRRQPFAVVLLDEVEKAHPDLFDLLLQVLGEGRLTDHRGQTADFCSTIVVLTSNLGAEASQRAKVGVAREAGEAAAELRAAVFRTFRPELVNRFDRILAFAPLSPAAVARVLDREIAALALQPALVERGATVEVAPDARAWLTARGHDPARGARPLQRLLRHTVVAEIAKALDAKPDRPAPQFTVRVVDDRLVVDVRPGPVGGATSVSDQVGGVRRRTRRVLTGGTLRELETAVALAERRARLAAEARELRALPEVMADLRARRAPLDALRGWYDTLVAREADAVAAELAGRPAPTFEDDAGRERTFTLARAVYDAVHPHHRTAFLGAWCPAADLVPVEIVATWADRVVAAAEAAGFEVGRRARWDLGPTGFATAEVAPKEARRWVGEELWIVGPAAYVWVAHLGGLYEHKALRVRVGVAAPEGPLGLACCGEVPTDVLKPEARPGRGTPEAWAPPRPRELLRQSTYEGDARPWPPTPGPGPFRAHLLSHVIGGGG